MKNKILLIFLILMILPIVKAANLQVEQLEKSSVIITENGNNATFKLKITNNENSNDEEDFASEKREGEAAGKEGEVPAAWKSDLDPTETNKKGDEKKPIPRFSAITQEKTPEKKHVVAKEGGKHVRLLRNSPYPFFFDAPHFSHVDILFNRQKPNHGDCDHDNQNNSF